LFLPPCGHDLAVQPQRWGIVQFFEGDEELSLLLPFFGFFFLAASLFVPIAAATSPLGLVTLFYYALHDRRKYGLVLELFSAADRTSSSFTPSSHRLAPEMSRGNRVGARGRRKFPPFPGMFALLP